MGGCSPRKGRNDDYDCDSEPTGWVDLLNHQGVYCPRFSGKETLGLSCTQHCLLGWGGMGTLVCQTQNNLSFF